MIKNLNKTKSECHNPYKQKKKTFAICKEDVTFIGQLSIS